MGNEKLIQAAAIHKVVFKWCREAQAACNEALDERDRAQRAIEKSNEFLSRIAAGDMTDALWREYEAFRSEVDDQRAEVK